MADKKDATDDDLHVGPLPGGDRKLSIPNSVQRRKWGSLGTYNRAVVCAVDQSERAKAAFMCTHIHKDNIIIPSFCDRYNRPHYGSCLSVCPALAPNLM